MAVATSRGVPSRRRASARLRLRVNIGFVAVTPSDTLMTRSLAHWRTARRGTRRLGSAARGSLDWAERFPHLGAAMHVLAVTPATVSLTVHEEGRGPIDCPARLDGLSGWHERRGLRGATGGNLPSYRDR